MLSGLRNKSPQSQISEYLGRCCCVIPDCMDDASDCCRQRIKRDGKSAAMSCTCSQRGVQLVPAAAHLTHTACHSLMQTAAECMYTHTHADLVLWVCCMHVNVNVNNLLAMSM